MKSIAIFLITLFSFTISHSLLLAKDFDKSRIDIGSALTVSLFQQQIKPEIGDARGERLTYDYTFGMDFHTYYIINEYIRAGLFVRYDIGNNRAALFDSISPEGTAVTKNIIEGRNNELWIGPRVWVGYYGFFSEFGWGVFGIRVDESRNDIADINGNTAESFDLNPAFAMQWNAGYGFEVIDDLYLNIKLEWRLRYYDGRGGEPLMGNIEHGTMNINPFVGVSYKF